MLLKQVDKIDKKNIVFDLTGVLFHPSRKFFLNEVGIMRLLWYGVRHFKNPLSIFDRGLDFLYLIDSYPQNQKDILHYKGRILPKCMCDCLVGKAVSRDILQKIENAFICGEYDDFFLSNLERSMILTVSKVLFSPELAVEKSLKPIEEGIDVLRAFYQKVDEAGERKHKIYLFSNFDNETFSLLTKKYHDVFACFDGMLTSAQVGSAKPEKSIYKAFFARYDLPPKECFFIDDQIDNITTGQELGMDGVVFVKK